MAGGARLRSRRRFRLRQPESALQLSGRAQPEARNLVSGRVTALNQMRAARHLGVGRSRCGAWVRRPFTVEDLGFSDGIRRAKPVGGCTARSGRGHGRQRRDSERRGHARKRTAELTLDRSSGLITDESMDALPEPYRVARYGASPKQVAITFDDGPDPQWTPKILDVLKREHAHGNFFSDRNSGRELYRPHRTHLRRRARDRQSHLHASRHQQHVE